MNERSDDVPDHSGIKLLRHSLADAIKILRRADKNLTVRNSRGAEAVIVQSILCQHFEFLSSLDHSRQSVLICQIDLAIAKHGRGTVGSRLQALLAINLFAGPGIQAPHNASVIHD